MPMKKISTEFNPHTGAMENWFWDGESEQMTIKSTYDVTDVLEANKAMASLSVDGRFGNDMLHHVAEIPNVFIHKFKKEHNLDVFSQDPSEQLRFRKLLESPEYRFLKTTVNKLYRPRSSK